MLEDEGGKGHKQQAPKQDEQDGGCHTDFSLAHVPFLRGKTEEKGGENAGWKYN